MRNACARFLRFRAARRSARRPASIKGDVIFATSTPLTIAIPALFASTLGRTPFVFEVRDMWPDVPIAMGALRNPVAIWLAQRLEMAAYRRAKHVVALAPGMREDIIKKGIPPEEGLRHPRTVANFYVFAAAPPASPPRLEYEWLGHRESSSSTQGHSERSTVLTIRARCSSHCETRSGHSIRGYRSRTGTGKRAPTGCGVERSRSIVLHVRRRSQTRALALAARRGHGRRAGDWTTYCLERRRSE